MSTCVLKTKSSDSNVLICGGSRQNVTDLVWQFKKGNTHKESKTNMIKTGSDWMSIYCIIRGGY